MYAKGNCKNEYGYSIFAEKNLKLYVTLVVKQIIYSFFFVTECHLWSYLFFSILKRGIN